MNYFEARINRAQIYKNFYRDLCFIYFDKEKVISC